MKIRNAKPKVYFGMHFQEGVAAYKDLDGQPVIFVNRDTAKAMDRTYQGKPVYVLHEDDVDLENVQDADGVVIRSFYNKLDGNHWSEFIVYTQEAQDAIEKKKWKLSNAYDVKETRGSGCWHGVDYDYEVADAEYEHLAIVPNPRYADSIILSVEEFKEYNQDKEAELSRLSNSKGEVMFELFKKKVEKVKNSKELSEMHVVLPKTKVEKSIKQLVNEADEAEESKGIANMDDQVEIEKDNMMSVKDLVNFYKENQSEDEMENSDEEEHENMDDNDVQINEDEEDQESDLDNQDEDEYENSDDEDEVDNEGDDCENSDKEEEEPKKNMKKKNSKGSKRKLTHAQKVANAKEKARVAAENYAKLANANKGKSTVANSVDLSEDKVARGKSRYGSN